MGTGPRVTRPPAGTRPVAQAGCGAPARMGPLTAGVESGRHLRGCRALGLAGLCVVEVVVRWRRDDRPAPDDRRDQGDDAENWLSDFRGQSVRPDALTAADRDAGGRRAAQVGSRPWPGEHGDQQPGREERRPRPPDGDDSGGRPPAPRPSAPRADLERDVGPWAGVQRAPEPDSDGRDRWVGRRDPAGWPAPPDPGRRRDRRQAGNPDTDEFARLERAGDRTAPDDRRRDPRAADPGSHAGDRRAGGVVVPDRADRPPGRADLRPDDGRAAFPAAPDWRRPGRRSQPGGDAVRDRVPPGSGRDGPGTPAPLPRGARPPEPGPRRENPAPWSDAGRQAPPAQVHGPGSRRDHEPGGRPDPDFWLAPRDRAPRPRPTFRAERPLPPAAGRAQSPDRQRPVAPELRALPAPPGAELARSDPGRSAPARSEPARSEPARSEPARSGAAQPADVASAQPAADGRPDLGANLTLADLERVRQALKLLSDESAGDSPVSPAGTARPSAVPSTASEQDEADTTPLPVILPSAAAVQGPELQEILRGPFEPAHVAQAARTAAPAPEGTAAPAPAGTAVPASDSTAVQAAEAAAVPVEAVPAGSADDLPPSAAAKLDQIKDLLITAEAIGEANLDQHFERVSQRQRELIREFFDRAMPGREPKS